MALTNPPAFGIGGAPRVNLMPRAEVERRERGVLLRRWVWGLVAALAAVAVLAGAAFWLQATAALRLAQENARTNDLLSRVAALAPVRAKLDLVTELQGFRTDAMATDLEWTRLLAAVEEVLPGDVTVAGFDLAPGRLPLGDDPLAAIGATGALTLESPTPVEIVPLIRAVRPLDTVLRADGWEVASESGAFTYLLRIGFDQSVYTGAFAAEVTG